MAQRNPDSVNKYNAFSLVELSIVLVILGLLVGGVLAGQSLIRASELRTISTDMSNYRAAAHTFQDKYFYLPGDMPNASTIWPSFPNKGNNGDGNGVIHENSSAGADDSENYKVWQHLSLAGLVSGIDNRGGAGGDFATEPKSKYGGSNYWGMYWETAYSNSAPSRLSANVLSLGNGSSGYNGYRSTSARYGVLRAEDAFNIDSKLDDGQPDNGTVFAYRGAGQGGCVNHDVFTTVKVDYILTDTTNYTCKIAIKL